MEFALGISGPRNGASVGIMNPTEKIAVAVKDMWGDNTKWCATLNILNIVAIGEHPPSPALDAVMDQIKAMQISMREMCGEYDKLRSMVGALELERGIENPKFYVDDKAGTVHKCRCPSLIR